jgi:hypothetical protein
MRYIHVSQHVANGMKVGTPSTFNIGRNAEKRRIRAISKRRTLDRNFGYQEAK